MRYVSHPNPLSHATNHMPRMAITQPTSPSGGVLPTGFLRRSDLLPDLGPFPSPGSNDPAPMIIAVTIALIFALISTAVGAMIIKNAVVERRRMRAVMADVKHAGPASEEGVELEVMADEEGVGGGQRDS